MKIRIFKKLLINVAKTISMLCGLRVCIILNQMKVDQYDDLIEPDFIAPRSEYEFQIIAGLNIALLLKVVLRAGRVFLINLLKSKKSK